MGAGRRHAAGSGADRKGREGNGTTQRGGKEPKPGRSLQLQAPGRSVRRGCGPGEGRCGGGTFRGGPSLGGGDAYEEELVELFSHRPADMLLHHREHLHEVLRRRAGRRGDCGALAWGLPTRRPAAPPLTSSVRLACRWLLQWSELPMAANRLCTTRRCSISSAMLVLLRARTLGREFGRRRALGTLRAPRAPPAGLRHSTPIPIPPARLPDGFGRRGLLQEHWQVGGELGNQGVWRRGWP